MSDSEYLAAGVREMAKSDLQGGTLSIANTAYDCNVGTFTKQDVLVAGGVSPKMMGDVQVLLEDIGDLDLKLGLQITVIPNLGKVRQCKLHSTQNAGNHVNILLWDINESA